MSQQLAWQETLRQEYQAVYGFGLVSGRLGPDDEMARASLTIHRDRAEICQGTLRAQGIEPAAPPPAYTAEPPVATDDQARELAASLEVSCSAAYAALAAEADPVSRRTGAAWLRTSAVDQFRWSGQLPALPGLTT